MKNFHILGPNVTNKKERQKTESGCMIRETEEKKKEKRGGKKRDLLKCICHSVIEMKGTELSAGSQFACRSSKSSPITDQKDIWSTRCSVQMFIIIIDQSMSSPSSNSLPKNRRKLVFINSETPPNHHIWWKTSFFEKDMERTKGLRSETCHFFGSSLLGKISFK